MPKYDYKCTKCGKVTIIEASIKAEKPEKIQCGCGGIRVRVFSLSSFHMPKVK